jgi:hypothetical protein
MQLLLENTYLVVFTIVFGAAICFSIVSFIWGTRNAIRAPVGFNRDWKGNCPTYPPEEFRRHAAECVSMAKFTHDR